MPVFASTTIGPNTDGAIYARNLLLPATEGDLYTAIPGQTFDPIPVLYAQSALAVVEFNNFNVATDTGSYVILQTALNDESWFDLAWCTWTGIGNSQGRFLLAAGALAAGSYQQTRQPGTAPSPANSSNSFPLGGRIRFVGKAVDTITGSSASSNPSGGGNGVYVNILVKLLGLR